MTVDHSAWNAFLRGYVRVGAADDINRVAYAAVPASARDALAADVKAQSALPVSQLRRAEQLAFWIDLYNEETVLLVLQHFPVASIRDIGGGLFHRGPWNERVLTVEGTALSLNDIEHRILRPGWRDNRVHVALNCASLGCPNLRATAYTGEGVGPALDEAARAFADSPRAFTVANGALAVSSIFVWYRADFGNTDAGVIATLRRWASPARAATLDGVGSIGSDSYDWRLNGADR